MLHQNPFFLPQREALDARIRTLSRSHIVHPGLPEFAGGKSGCLAIADIPGAQLSRYRIFGDVTYL